MKSWLNYFIGLLMLASHVMFGQQAVYIDAREKGTGILKSRTSECFVITPAHVVKNENRPFTIRGSRSVLSRGEKSREYESDDLAIVRVIDGGAQNCEDWNVETNYEEILAKTNEGFLETAQINGGVKAIQVFLIEKDETTITIRTRFPNDKIIKGMSGSLLFTSKNGNKIYLGMLLEISGPTEGVVLQANRIDKVLSSFFEIKPAATDKGKLVNPTVSQANRYKSMISIIDELLSNATKAYDLSTNVIWKHHDCDVVEQSVKINKIVGLSLKSLTTKIYEDEALVKESSFNVRPIKDLILEIDQWEEDYNKLIDKHKSPCKMPMFAPMQYLMLRGDLIELKGELNKRLNIKDPSSKLNTPVNNAPVSTKTNPTKSDPIKPKSSQAISATRKFLYLPFADMVYVPGGTFKMGDDDGNSDEKPAHNVTLNSFYMGKYEVTQGQWEHIMGNNPSYQKEPKAFSKEDCSECPVEQVSWKDAKEFLKKLNDLTKENYRLPTEAEWEYAAGGGAGKRTRFGNGQDVLTQKQANYDQLANKRDDDYYMRTMKVGSFLPNRLGLHDMAGNVFEWCNDWAGDYPDSDKVNPTGPSVGTRRIVRGGSYAFPPEHCEVTHRTTQSPSYTFLNLGFRIVLSAP